MEAQNKGVGEEVLGDACPSVINMGVMSIGLSGGQTVPKER